MIQVSSGSRPILITGANGFVGRKLMTALRQRFPDLPLVGTSHAPAVGLIDVDIADNERVRDLIGRHRPQACIHLAANSSVAQSFSNPIGAAQTNFMGTLYLANAILDLCPETLFVFASSGEIYGQSFSGRVPIDEGAALSPLSPYASTKAAADLVIGQMAIIGLRAVRLRLFNHTGPGQSTRFVIPRIASQVAAIADRLQRPVIETGPLDGWRDFLDVADVVEAYLAVLLRDAPEGGPVYNICSGTPRQLRDIARDFIRLAGVEAELREKQGETRPYDIPFSAGIPAAFEADYGWSQKIAWEDTLRAMTRHWSRL